MVSDQDMASPEDGAPSKIEDLRRRKAHLYAGGGERRIAQQHEKGKLTARERLALFFDEDTFQETHLFMRHRCTRFGMQDRKFPSEGVVTGYGLVGGRPIYAAAEDFTVAGGAVGEATARKIQELMRNAEQTGDPFVFINDSGGHASRRASTPSPATAGSSTAT